MIDLAGEMQPPALVIRYEYFLQYAGETRSSVLYVAPKANDDIVERGRHANEVYEPQDRCFRAV